MDNELEWTLKKYLHGVFLLLLRPIAWLIYEPIAQHELYSVYKRLKNDKL